MNRCIMVATDGGRPALGALRCAADIAQRLELPLEVISVCEPGSVFGYGPVDLVAGVMEEIAEAARNIRKSELRDQLVGAGVGSLPLIHVEIGVPAPTISSIATQRGAEVIVLGVGGHSTLDRVLGDETAMRLMQAAHVPVMSVPEEYSGLPNRVLAAVDFTSFSRDAARGAATLLGPAGELHLVHVLADQPAPDGGWRQNEWLRAMRRELAGRLEEVAADIATSTPGVTIATHLVEGRPVPAILHLAKTLEVDMLATGTSGYGFLGRLLMGSVATQIVRRSRGMTLVAPPRGIVPPVNRSSTDAWRNGHARARQVIAEATIQAS